MTNLVILSGNIGNDPDSRYSRSGTTITNFSLATSRNVMREGQILRGQDGYAVKDTEWHRIVCFKGLAEAVNNYCPKGSRVQVKGRIHYTKWTDQQGIERYGCEIIAETIDFLSRTETPTQQPEKKSARKPVKKTAPVLERTLDDEVPF